MLADFVANRESRMIMEDLAWRKLFGRPVEEDERRMISLIPVIAGCEGGATKTNLLAAVTLDVNCSVPTARKRIDRCVDQGLIVASRDAGNATRIIMSVPDTVQARVAQIEALQPLIARIVAAQHAAPDDPNAGRELLPEDMGWIYFNARDEANVQAMRAEVAKVVAQIKESKT